MRKMFVILSMVAAFGVRAQSPIDFDEEFSRASSGETHLTIRFLTGTFPTNLVLGTVYSGPAVATNAWYDSGDGIWRTYTSKNIPVVGSYVRFRGDWRTSAGSYYGIFSGTLQSASFTCRTEGTLDYAANGINNAYREAFYNAAALVNLKMNPFQRMTGAPAASMCYATFYGCSGLTSIPAGTCDTSGLTGAPAFSMCRATFYGCSGLTSLPAGTCDMSGLTGAPADLMCYYTFYGCSGLTSLPAGTCDTSGLTGAPAAAMFQNAFYGCAALSAVPSGTLDTSGLTGAPAAAMFQNAFYGCAALTNKTVTIGIGVSLTSSNLVSSSCLSSMFQGCRSWPGGVYWGTNLIYNAIPVPDGDINTFSGCTNMTNYGTINANWK